MYTPNEDSAISLGDWWTTGEEVAASQRGLHANMLAFNTYVSQNWNRIPETLRQQWKGIRDNFSAWYANASSFSDQSLFSSATMDALHGFEDQFRAIKAAIERAVGSSSGIIQGFHTHESAGAIESAAGNVLEPVGSAIKWGTVIVVGAAATLAFLIYKGKVKV